MRRAAGGAPGSFLRAGIGVSLTVLLIGCERTGPGAEGEPPDVLSSGADQVMVGVEHYMTRDGIRRARLDADTAYTYQDSSRISLRNLRLTFFAADGAETAVLTGKTGDYWLESGDMVVEGGVHVTGDMSGEGESQLDTDKLRFDASTNRLISDSPYTLVHPDGTVEQGTGFDSDPAMTDINSENLKFTSPSVEVPQ